MRWIFSCLLCIIAITTVNASSSDSVYIDKTTGKHYLVHLVKQGETMYSLSRDHGISVEQLKNCNHLQPEVFSLNIGQKILIPMPPEDQKTEDISAVKTLNIANLRVHIVNEGETLYSISKEYDGVSVEEIKKLNKLRDNTVKTGQQLIIPPVAEVPGNEKKKDEGISIQPVDETTMKKEGKSGKAITDAEVNNKNDKDLVKKAANIDTLQGTTKETENTIVASLHKKYDNAIATEGEMSAEEIATWFDDPQGYGQDRYFALNDKVPIGTVIKVENTINHLVIYVKVIDRMPESGVNKGSALRLSYAAAKALNFLDERVLVRVTMPGNKGEF